jgi:hypothetical protein
MTELTTLQMADIHGMKFWEGFLCGIGVIASIGISGTPDPMVRWGIYNATIGACGMAFS